LLTLVFASNLVKIERLLPPNLVSAANVAKDNAADLVAAVQFTTLAKIKDA
jgi:hypothetical protein